MERKSNGVREWKGDAELYLRGENDVGAQEVGQEPATDQRNEWTNVRSFDSLKGVFLMPKLVGF